MRNLLSRLLIVVIAVPALALALAQSSSAQSTPFTEARFDSLQTAGELILVDIWASWCPVCAMQEIILERYQKMYPDSPIHFLKVNFDTQKDRVTEFRAPRQSTLILFRGDEQLWFSVAETRDQVIFEALDAAAFQE